MRFQAKHTRLACYLAYIAGATVNNLPALLFVTFRKDYALTLEALASLVMVNFAVQMCVDILGAKYADRIGYRRVAMISMGFCALGLVSLAVLPRCLPPYAGLCAATVAYAIGSGLSEVIISPIVEALPASGAGSMSLLHAFYCIGFVIMVALSTLFFRVCGTANWPVLSVLWAAVPAFDLWLFSRVPIVQLRENEEKMPLAKLFSVKIIWVFLLLMVTSGAAEQSMGQWASYFAETELHVSKQEADLLGPCLFAAAMGAARMLYAAFAAGIPVRTALVGSGFFVAAGYMLAALSPLPLAALAGCAVSGFGVGVLWPGVLSLAAKRYPAGGTAMFGLLALGGDVGCFSGPFLVARASSAFTDGEPSVKTGILAALIFPALLVTAAIAVGGDRKNTGKS